MKYIGIGIRNTDMDMIDNCVDDVYELTKDKDIGIGIIRINDNEPIAEYYSSFNDIRKFDPSKNLCMVKSEDHMERSTIRQACLMRYTVMRDEYETKT